MSEIKGYPPTSIEWPADFSERAKSITSPDGYFKLKAFLTRGGYTAAHMQPTSMPIFFTGDSLAQFAKGLAEVAEWMVAQDAKVTPKT